MTTFEEFTRARYTTLLQQRAQLYAQLRAVQKEMEEIERASRASGLQLIKSEAPKTNDAHKSKKTTKTMKDASIETLKKHPNGLPAVEILLEVNKILGSNYVRSSLSPQLSRLKKDGIIYDTNGIWTLTEGATRHQ